MNIETKSATLPDFFASAKETAREIDRGKLLTSKKIVWVDPKEPISGRSGNKVVESVWDVRK